MTSGKEDDAAVPPERDFDQSTAWERMEEAAAEAIADLPDFPGFAVRTMSLRTCSHSGEVDDDYINLELGYQFDEMTSQDPLVRETYLELFRDRWGAAGYDIHRDQPSGTGKHHALEARRTDGINYWYSVAGLTVLLVQSGCVRKVENWAPVCPDPLPSVTKANDRARAHCGSMTTNYPEETEDTQAIDPFGSAQAHRPFGR